jgi:hypothetical protein
MEFSPYFFDFFDLFDFAVNLFFNVCCFSGNVDVEKVNADALLPNRFLVNPAKSWYATR